MRKICAAPAQRKIGHFAHEDNRKEARKLKKDLTAAVHAKRFNQIDKDATTLGAQWAAFLRAAMFPALISALHERDAGHHTLFLNELECGVAARCAAAPEQMRIPLALVVIEKKERSHH